MFLILLFLNLVSYIVSITFLVKGFTLYGCIGLFVSIIFTIFIISLYGKNKGKSGCDDDLCSFGFLDCGDCGDGSGGGFDGGGFGGGGD